MSDHRRHLIPARFSTIWSSASSQDTMTNSRAPARRSRGRVNSRPAIRCQRRRSGIPRMQRPLLVNAWMPRVPLQRDQPVVVLDKSDDAAAAGTESTNCAHAPWSRPAVAGVSPGVGRPVRGWKLTIRAGMLPGPAAGLSSCESGCGCTVGLRHAPVRLRLRVRAAAARQPAA